MRCQTTCFPGGDTYMLSELGKLELPLLEAINSAISCPFLDAVFKIITFTGNAGIIWIICAALMLFFKKSRKCGIALSVALILSLVLNNLALKNIIARLRPFQLDESISLIIPPPSEYSFPSGHTLSSFASAFVIWFYHGHRFGIIATVWAALIGFSRIYLRVHFISDVIGGAIIGIGIGFLAVIIVKHLYIYHNDRCKKHLE